MVQQDLKHRPIKFCLALNSFSIGQFCLKSDIYLLIFVFVVLYKFPGNNISHSVMEGFCFRNLLGLFCDFSRECGDPKSRILLHICAPKKRKHGTCYVLCQWYFRIDACNHKRCEVSVSWFCKGPHKNYFRLWGAHLISVCLLNNLIVVIQQPFKNVKTILSSRDL